MYVKYLKWYIFLKLNFFNILFSLFFFFGICQGEIIVSTFIYYDDDSYGTDDVYNSIIIAITIIITITINKDISEILLALKKKKKKKYLWDDFYEGNHETKV